MWLTTFDGLARFDGVRFTVFDKGNTKGINSNRLTDLYEASDGSLLIATQDSGLAVYKNGSFTAYTTADGLPSNRVYGMTVDFDGEPVISATGGPVYLRGGTLVPAPLQFASPERKTYLAPSGARVTVDASGVTWVKDGREIHYAITISVGNYAAEVWPFEDSRENLWLAGGRNLYVLRDGHITHFPEGGFRGPLCEDADGGVWIAGVMSAKGGGESPARFKDGRQRWHYQRRR